MKRLFLASLTLLVLASCEKVSTLDSALTTDKAMTFAPYAGASTTRGSAVDSNDAFIGTADKPGSFKVASFVGSESYFGFKTVTYNSTEAKWKNTENMYWPNYNATLHFGAYYPAASTQIKNAAYSYASAHALTFDYTVNPVVGSQEDLMFAASDCTYTVSTTDVDPAEAKLHFKHALTQVGFTATKDADIEVTVNSIKLCNIIDNGGFTATISTDDSTNVDDNNNGAEDAGSVELGNFGEWTPATATARVDDETVTNLANYTAVMANNKTADAGVVVNPAAGQVAQLTSTTDVMMLLPHEVKAWDPKDATVNPGVGSFLAIDCKIVHAGGQAPIMDGIIYVPFSSKGIEYTAGTLENIWKQGYKLTYKLHFGGGFTDPGKDPGKDPEPGETPNPEDVIPTLRAITYTVSVDEWIPCDGGELEM